MYHNIAQAPRQLQVYRSLYVAPARFARQMRLLRRLGYRGVFSRTALELSPAARAPAPWPRITPIRSI